jgi:hypothetical protein
VIEIHVNPADIDNEYLRHLNLAYGSWGDRQQFDWYFKRQTAYPNADLIVLTVDDCFAAGSGVSYRQVALPARGEITVGIVTGAWTLPEFRNQGCFAQVIRTCLSVTARRGGALLLGFVKAENASSRQMARLGSAMFPVWYLRSRSNTSTPRGQTDFAKVPIDDQLLAEVFENVNTEGRGYARFVYPTIHDFSAQLICRPAVTEILVDRQGNHGVIERRAGVDVLQLISTHSKESESLTSVMADLRNYSQVQGRELLSFTTLPSIAAAGVATDFELRNGFLTALIADEESLRTQAGIDLSAANSCRMADIKSPFFLGTWNVHGGERL